VFTARPRHEERHSDGLEPAALNGRLARSVGPGSWGKAGAAARTALGTPCDVRRLSILARQRGGKAIAPASARVQYGDVNFHAGCCGRGARPRNALKMHSELPLLA